MKKQKFAPRKVFEEILEYAVIPTFDLVIEYGGKGVIIARRKIPPYQNKWSLPGLRILKGENIEDALTRIAKQELGLKINPKRRKFVGQYTGKFKTEHNRQDLSTGDHLKVSSNQPVILNSKHFSAFRITKSIPAGTGAMYKFYLKNFFAR